MHRSRTSARSGKAPLDLGVLTHRLSATAEAGLPVAQKRTPRLLADGIFAGHRDIDDLRPRLDSRYAAWPHIRPRLHAADIWLASLDQSPVAAAGPEYVDIFAPTASMKIR